MTDAAETIEEVETPEPAAIQARWARLRPDLDAAWEHARGEPLWRRNLHKVATAMRKKLAAIREDQDAILARLDPDVERPALALCFERLPELLTIAQWCEIKHAMERAQHIGLTRDKHKALREQVKAMRAALLAQAPLWVALGVLSPSIHRYILKGNGPIDWSRDLILLTDTALDGWDKLAALQQAIHEAGGELIDAPWLNLAQRRALDLQMSVLGHAHNLRDMAPRDVSWRAQLGAALYLIRLDWEAICAAAQYHYLRGERRDKLKHVVPLGALR